MTWLSLGAFFLLVIATYLSSITMGLVSLSRSAVAKRTNEDAADWLFERVDPMRWSVSLVRTAIRLTFFAFVFLELVGIANPMTFTVWDLAWAGLITLIALWVGTVIIASAVARYAATGIVCTALPLLRGVYVVCYPLTRSLAFIDEVVRRLTGANLVAKEEAEAELLRSIDETTREGGLDERSAALLENVVEFSSTDVGEVMTPRTDIDGIELTNDLAEIRSFINEVGHSRIPVYEENLDHIVGVLYVKDLVGYLGEEAADFALRPILRQPNVVPETKPVRELLADFQKSEIHMAIVIDEYGGTAGLVTIEDVLEEIVGEIHDEHDADDDEAPALATLDDRRAEVDGRFHIDDLNERLGLTLPEDEEYDTVAGFVLAHLGHVPEVGESFEAESARFTALAATPTHVKRIGIELLEVVGRNGERG